MHKRRSELLGGGGICPKVNDELRIQEARFLGPVFLVKNPSIRFFVPGNVCVGAPIG